jgi:hypothetical protein
MNLISGLNGRALHTALSEQPSLSLNFYSFGITLRKQEGDLAHMKQFHYDA